MQNKKLIPMIIGIVVVLAVAAFAYMQSKPVAAPAENDAATSQQPTGTAPADTPAAPESGPGQNQNPTTTPGPTAYTMAQVALHASVASCWTVIRGNIYDLTTWIGQHPGGAEAITKICGTDGTAAFEGQHGGSAPQENKLATFKIGVIAQ